jgi:hypothetical protein
MISDTLSLLVFAVCLSTYVGGFSLQGITLQIIEIAGSCRWSYLASALSAAVS